MSDYSENVAKYTSSVNEAAVAGIVKHLGIALRSRDASLVSCSDKSELDRVRKSFCNKKMSISDDAAVDAAIKEVCEKMKAERQKSRVTFYYLLAEKFGNLSMFG